MKKSLVALTLAATFVAVPSPAFASKRPHSRAVPTTTTKAHVVVGKHKSTRPAERLVVLRAGVAPHQFPSKGGRATITASVKGATTCWVTTTGGPYSVKVSIPKPVRCAGGSYKQVLTFGPNVTKSAVVVKLKLTVDGANGKIANRALFVVVAGRHVVLPHSPKATPPAVLRASATPAQLSANGGLVVAAGSVRGATTCRLVVLSTKELGNKGPSTKGHSNKALGGKGLQVTLPKPVACSAGMYGQPVTFGPNKSAGTVTVKLALIATGTKGASARGVFYVVQTGQGAPSAVPVGMLPLGVSVKVVGATGSLGRSHVASTSVASLPVVVHMAATGLGGPAHRLTFSDVQGQVMASVPAPSTCGQYLVKFSKPVPPSTLLLLGLVQRWGKGTWVPDGPRVFFTLAHSPIAFTVQGAKSGSTPVILGKGATAC